MARTESNMLDLGTLAPDFSLPDTVSDRILSWADVKSDTATVVMFICNHCPFVLHVNAEIVQLAHDYQAQGVNFVGISSNDVVNYPQDSPEKMKIQAAQVGYTFPYLYDESQATAKAYDAACTPDFYLFDKDSRLVYRGQMDASRPGNGIDNDGRDLRAALDAVLNQVPVNPHQMPSVGCGIKWKH